jgi:hypothetical protein
MVQFGSFDDICATAALVVCPLLGTNQGIEPTCYSRNVDIGSTLIFQPGAFPDLISIYLIVNARTLWNSYQLCTYRGDNNDNNNDNPYQEQIHRRRSVIM